MGVPCLILSGFLGSGKTTYLNSLLREANGLRLGILVNDFGDVPIDYDLIEAADENILELTGGCVCCSYGGDLISAVTQMLSDPDRFDALIIETSGLSLPGIVAASVRIIPGVRGVSVLGIVDGKTIGHQINDKYLSDTVVRQIQEADLVLVTKITNKDHLARNHIEQIVKSQLPGANLLFALSTQEMMHRLFASSSVPSPPRTNSPGSLFESPMRLPDRLSAPIIPVSVPASETYNVEAVIERVLALDCALVRAKGIFRVSSRSYAVVQFAGGAWEVFVRSAPPTRPGMTFFVLADIAQKNTLIDLLCDVFKAATIDE
jgi:G3E family GTPase